MKIDPRLLVITKENLSEHLQRAYQFRQEQKIVDAALIASECLKHFPQDAEINFLNGLLLLDLHKAPDAERFFNTAITLNPQKEDYYLVLGKMLQDQRRYLEARNAFQQCLKINARHFQAWYLLGVLNFTIKNTFEARNAFEKVAEINPDFTGAHYYLGMIYYHQGKNQPAIAAYEKALQAEPKNESILCALGAALLRDKHYQKAIHCFEEALQSAPDYLPALTNLGAAYIECNQLEKAQPYARKAVQLDENNAANWRNLSLAQHYTSLNDPDVIALKKFINSYHLTENDKVNLLFALGKIHDECEHYDEAFAYYSTANALLAKNMLYNPIVLNYTVEQTLQFFNKIKLPKLHLKSTPHPQPLFIVGTSRSGKSLLEQLLSQHPHIHAGDEIGLSDTVFQLSYPYWLKDFTPEKAQRVKDAYVKALLQKTGPVDGYVTDTIPNNMMTLGILALLFPEAKFIHIKRNPLDACVMMFFKYYLYGHPYRADLQQLGAYYQQYEKMMAYWQEKLTQPILEIDYETLVQHPQQTLQKVMKFLDLNKDTVFDVSKISPKEINHWQHYQKNLAPLEQALKVKIVLTDAQEAKRAQLQEWVSTAYSSFRQGNLSQADLIAKSILALDAHAYPVFQIQGMISYEQQQYEQAIDYLKQAIALAPEVPALYIDLSQVLDACGRKQEASQAFDLAQKLQEKIKNKQLVVLTRTQRQSLLDAFLEPPIVLDESEVRLLLQGKIDAQSSLSYLTRSWDHYFKDLSFGSYTATRERAWHFLFKNLAVIDNILHNSDIHLRILDVGCASGYFRRFLEGNIIPRESQSVYYWGLDIRLDKLEEAIKGFDDIESGAPGNLVPSAFLNHDIQFGLPFRDNYFDYVVNFEMLKYLPVAQGKLLLAEIYRVLKPHGQFYLSTMYDSTQPGFMQSVPYEQIEHILQETGFTLLQRRGSQMTFQHLNQYAKERHIPFIKELLAVHPKEMVVAMLAPLYPQCALQVTFHLQK